MLAQRFFSKKASLLATSLFFVIILSCYLIWKLTSPSWKNLTSQVIITPSQVGEPLNFFSQEISYHNTNHLAIIALWTDYGNISGSVEGLAFSPNSKLLATGTGDSLVRLWEIEGAQVTTILPHASGSPTIAFQSNDNIIASESQEIIQIWDISNKNILFQLNSPGGVRNLAFNPSDSLLASGSLGDTVHLWKVENGSLLFKLKGHSIAFSPDGTTLATGDESGIIYFWEVSSGKLINSFAIHEDGVDALAFSSDGTILASGSQDGNINLLDTNSGQLLHTLRGHTDWVNDIAFSRDDTLLISVANDLRFWRISNGNLVKKFDIGFARSIAVSPNGKLIAAGSEGGDRIYLLGILP